jgi:glucose-6-phosphate 1-epimerase
MTKSIQQHDLKPGYPVLDIQHPRASGRIALNGGHVMEWMPEGAQPVLYMSAEAVLEPGKAIRGGIPICWPWFGPHSDASKPAHGLVRTLMWEFDRARESEEAVDLVLKLTDSEASRSLWPHAFEARLHIRMGLELEVGLELVNTDRNSWSMSGALHTYLNVGDVRDCSIHGLHGTQYVESRLSAEKRPQHGAILIDQEVDRLYASDAAVIVHDTLFQRELRIEKSGSLSTVVWNPWIEKSKRLSDLPDEAYPEFVCVETANAGEDTITLQPGESHLLFTRLCVRSLMEEPVPLPAFEGFGLGNMA